MRTLHPVQQKLIDLLSEHMEEPLTIREMQEHLGLSSTSLVAHHLNQLERKGYLKRNHGNPRDYQIVKDGPERRVVYLNLYGLAQCGPNGSILDGNPMERIPIPSRILSFPSSEAFMVKARGNSMMPRINDGDYVIARKSPNAQVGDVVVCVRDGETLIKKLGMDDEGPFLISLNTDYGPIRHKEELRIEGIVKIIISNSPWVN